MIPNANARHFRLKAAQRDLIAAAGGIERSAAICSYGKSTVGRWANIDSPELMPHEAVDMLETETGLTVWTVAWVEGRGLKLATPERHAEQTCLTGEMGALMTDLGALLGEWGMTSADGHASPTEAERLRRLITPLRDRFSKLEDVLAKVKAEGGLSLVKGVA